MMNARMTKFFEELHQAEFGNDDLDLQSDEKEFIRLLKRAVQWESHENLQLVCDYLGLDDDDRYETLEGVREMISETIEYSERKLKGE